MPRYFFHRVDGGIEPDLTGTDCEDVSEARLEAIVFAGDSIRRTPELVWAGGEMRIEVTDEAGSLVTTVIVMAINAKNAVPQNR